MARARTYTSYLTNLTATPQTQAIPGRPEMVKNAAGGFAWEVTPQVQLERFLCIGSEGGSYYTTPLKLTRQNAQAITKLLAQDGVRAVETIREFSHAGRIPRNSTALFALALASDPNTANIETRMRAFEVLPDVARTLSFLFEYVEYADAMRGWGRGLRGAIQNWFATKSDDDLMYQALKYRERQGWAVADLMRKAHVKADNAERNHLYDFMVHGISSEAVKSRVGSREGVWGRAWAYEQVRKAGSLEEVLALVRDHRLSWEMVPAEYHGKREFWRSVFPQLPVNALLRNLGRLTANGTLAPLSDAVHLAVSKLTDREALRRGRIHPMTVLAMLKMYASGSSGGKSSLTWMPNPAILDALDAAYYMAFEFAPATGKRIVAAVDVSGSMTSFSDVVGIKGMRASEAAAAMLMLVLRTEKNAYPIGFDTKTYDIGVTARMQMRDVLARISNLSGNGTDCSVPIRWAAEKNIVADAFILVTDGYSWAGPQHLSQAIRDYRRKTGVPAKLFVIYTTAQNTQLNDPQDALSGQAAGFDARLPVIINSFLGGAATPADDDDL